MDAQERKYSFSNVVDKAYKGARHGISEAFKNVVTYIAASTIYLPTHGQRAAEIMREEGWELVSCEPSDLYSDEDTTKIYQCPEGGEYKTSSTYYQAARATAAMESRAEIKEIIFPKKGYQLTV